MSLRLLSNLLDHGTLFYFKAAYIFDLSRLPERLPIYLLALLVLLPGGLVLAMCYKGRRRPELILSVILFVGAYLVQAYYMWETSLLKRVVLTPRYMTAIVPVIAFGAAEAIPRLWRDLRRRLPERRRGALEAVSAAVLAVWIGGVAVASIAVHPTFSAWSATQKRIRDAIQDQTGLDSVVVTNWMATRKFVEDLHSTYMPMRRTGLSPEDARTLVDRHGEFFIVLLDRSDSSHGISESAINAEFIASMEPARPVLLLDEHFTPTDHLRIWRVGKAQPGS